MKRYRIAAFILMIITLMTSIAMPTSASTNANDKVYESFEAACDVIRYGIVQWRNDINTKAYSFYFSVSFKAKSYDKDKLYDDLFKEVFKHTGTYYKGDSLRANMQEIGFSTSAKKSGNQYIVTVDVYGEYIVTRSKIRKLNKWIENNALWLATKKYKTGSSDYGKAYGIFLWITKNCHYGRKETDGIINSHITAYGAKYNQAVCHGIAHLYYMMAVRCGLQCRMMISGDHAWVVVKINGNWYIVDPTFALGKKESAAKKYFLIGYSNYSRYSKRKTNMYGGSIKVSKTNYKKR